MLINPPTWTQNGEYTAEQDRRLIGAIVRSEGVATISGLVPKVITNSRQISIGSGGAYISGDYAQSGGGGMYFSYNDGAFEVAIPVAGSLPRYDLVVLRIYDSAVSGSVNEARFEVVSGTPASSPRIPAVPRSSIAIAAARVRSGSAQLQTSDLTDQRTIAQLNGTITGNVSSSQASRLDQAASPSNPILITSSSDANSLLLSTGNGFQTVGSSQVHLEISDFPRSATEGTIVTSRRAGRTYQMRDGRWRMFSGWGPFVSVGRTVDVSHQGPYVGGILLNTGTSTGWGDEAPISSDDYSTYFSVTKGTSGSTLSRAGGITFKRPGKYHVEYKYQVEAARSGKTAVRSRIAGPGISQFTTADNLENYMVLDKGEEGCLSASGTIVVSSTGNSTHGKIVPWLRTSVPLYLRNLLVRVELEYEF